VDIAEEHRPFNAVEFCAGYAGIHLGLKQAIPALRVVAFSEIEAFAAANLVAKMEAGLLDVAPIWTDLKTFPGLAFRGKVDLLVGGFPCQGFSAAGKRLGDTDPRHLWPFFVEQIRLMRPSYCFFENVDGIISSKLTGEGWNDPPGTSVLLHVCRELERLGYVATAGVFSAAEVGAPHQRKRVLSLQKGEAAARQPPKVNLSEDCPAERLRNSPNLEAQAGMWPTVSASETKQNQSPRTAGTAGTQKSLSVEVLWPTISVNESKNSEMGSQAASSSPPLGTAVHLFGPQDLESHSTGGSRQEPISLGSEPPTDTMILSTKSKKLNPRWVETLMGLPIGWTQPSCMNPLTIGSMSCASLETESSPPAQRKLGECCSQGSEASAQATPCALNIDESYYQRSGNLVYPGLAKQVRDEATAWPSPRASDAEHGGPNQRGSKGDLALPSAVLQDFSAPLFDF